MERSSAQNELSKGKRKRKAERRKKIEAVLKDSLAPAARESGAPSLSRLTQCEKMELFPHFNQPTQFLPTQRALPETRCEKQEYLRLIEKVLLARDPKKLTTLEVIEDMHWGHMHQALRVIEQKYEQFSRSLFLSVLVCTLHVCFFSSTWETFTSRCHRYGPAPGRPWVARYNNHARFQHFFCHDYPEARGQLLWGKTVDQLEEEEFGGDAGSDVFHDCERLFLQLEHFVGPQKTPPQVFALSPKEQLLAIYRKACPERLANVDRILSEARGHEAQLVRAVLERHLPEKLQPAPCPVARLNGFCAEYSVAFSEACPKSKNTFEHKMLQLVLSYGPEPSDVWEFEMKPYREHRELDVMTPAM
ncbi:hypothetical protein DIPPA_54089 [Diplonema papillatum]|nr:hypothetical protein DIPPA_54089 [Diplonema papillatum]